MGKSAQHQILEAQLTVRSKNTVEYYVYYLALLTIPFMMFKSVYDVSKPSHPGYKKLEPLLEDGWIPGRKVDNSDAQYAGFRENIPYMAILLILHPLLRRAYEAVKSTPKNGGKDADADARLQNRVTFDLFFALILIVALHGISSLKVLTILYLNYQIATALPRQYVAVTTWVFNIGILFANELCQGYKFADLAAVTLPPTITSADKSAGANWGTWLDSFGGLIPRWEILFNITVLRLIAFSFDHLWMLDRIASSPIEKKGLDPANLSERERTSVGAKPSDFTFRNYLAYVLYSPLYLAGPIINFNDYISQSRYPMPTTSRSRIIPYAIRFVLCLLCMELVLHFLYAVAISKSNPDWNIYSPFQLSMLGYFNLHVIWLKLLLPWRFFRLWSLIDGIDPPENMVRCMSDNYSALAFWRGWHRSFNRFVVRYIYVPLGGSSHGKVRGILNFLAVFTFVALWHDINLRLLMWGWLITLFVLPEILATLAFPAKKWKDRPEQYRWLCGVGAVGNILMMMAANLVGFAVGLDGLRGLVDGIIGNWGGRVFLLAAMATLFVGAQIMFEVREAEKRRGVSMKC
ncbi:Putative membrane bound O-acyl transferase, MBOAT [Septoria linicola]|uniref:Membrane bound O-acyl transferase, MBOAT n=1 Tax=Septoria linicola TaxID=215465 RepID=A0A9Q9B8Q6_9PEZI|nr:Putative membrane bound O-acyl transferase, MBOAT [Septoria linicola]